jgi:hypothetical protein
MQVVEFMQTVTVAERAAIPKRNMRQCVCTHEANVSFKRPIAQ